MIWSSMSLICILINLKMPTHFQFVFSIYHKSLNPQIKVSSSTFNHLPCSACRPRTTSKLKSFFGDLRENYGEGRESSGEREIDGIVSLLISVNEKQWRLKERVNNEMCLYDLWGRKFKTFFAMLHWGIWEWCSGRSMLGFWFFPSSSYNLSFFISGVEEL